MVVAVFGASASWWSSASSPSSVHRGPSPRPRHHLPEPADDPLPPLRRPPGRLGARRSGAYRRLARGGAVGRARRRCGLSSSCPCIVVLATGAPRCAFPRPALRIAWVSPWAHSRRRRTFDAIDPAGRARSSGSPWPRLALLLLALGLGGELATGPVRRAWPSSWWWATSSRRAWARTPPSPSPTPCNRSPRLSGTCSTRSRPASWR